MKLVNERDVAIDSEDHKNPLGTRYDNSTNKVFLSYLTQLFKDKELRILDLGCSGGAFVKDCFDMGHEAYGLEGSDYSIKKQRAEWRTIPEFLFVCDITKHFHFEDEFKRTEYFDVITAWEVVEHLTEDELKEFARNIRYSLRGNGLCILSVANTSSKCNGVELHKTQKNKQWWINFFKQYGLLHREDLIKFFNRQWVRGEYESNKEFHLVLCIDKELSPSIPSIHPLRKLLNTAIYMWKGTFVYRIIRKFL